MKGVDGACLARRDDDRKLTIEERREAVVNNAEGNLK